MTFLVISEEKLSSSSSIMPRGNFPLWCATALAMAFSLAVVIMSTSPTMMKPVLATSRNCEFLKPSFQPNFNQIEDPEEIARGSQGVVYKASISGCAIALKCFPKNPHFYKTEKHNLQMVQGCPNVLKMYGFIEAKQCILMPLYSQDLYAQYEDLHKVSLRDRFMRLARIMRDVINGLQCIHSKNMIYGDLKPENILVGFPGTAKDTEVGTAKGMAMEMAMEMGQVVIADLGSLSTPRQTGAAYISSGMRTKYYSAPEMFLLQKEWTHMAVVETLGNTVDVYAVAQTFLAMVNGKDKDGVKLHFSYNQSVHDFLKKCSSLDDLQRPSLAQTSDMFTSLLKYLQENDGDGDAAPSDNILHGFIVSYPTEFQHRFSPEIMPKWMPHTMPIIPLHELVFVKRIESNDGTMEPNMFEGILYQGARSPSPSASASLYTGPVGILPRPFNRLEATLNILTTTNSLHMVQGCSFATGMAGTEKYHKFYLIVKQNNIKEVMEMVMSIEKQMYSTSLMNHCLDVVVGTIIVIAWVWLYKIGTKLVMTPSGDDEIVMFEDVLPLPFICCVAFVLVIAAWTSISYEETPDPEENKKST